MNKTKQTIATKATYTGDIPNTPFRFLLYVTKPFRFWAFFSLITVIIVVVMSTLSVLIVQKIIGAAEARDVQAVAILAILYPIYIFTIESLWRISGITGRLWVIGVEKYSTDLLATYTMQHSHTFFSDRFAGSLLSKVGNVTGAMSRLVMDILWHHLDGFIALITAGVLIFSVDLITGGIFTLLVMTLITVNYFLVPRKRVFSLSLAESKTRTRGRLVDVFSNISATRQYTRINDETESFQEYTQNVRDRASVSWLYTEYMMLVNSVILVVFASGMLFILLDRWTNELVSTGQFVAIMLLIFNLSHMMVFLGRTFNDTAASYGEAEEGLSDLLIPLEINDVPGALKLETNGGQIDWKNVTFEFGNNAVFDNFDLSIKSGQRIGLVGHSGAGKTTFVSLLLRQHDIESGAIEIDGQNIAKVTQDSLRENIAVVPQEPLLFHRTIRDNIAYGKSDSTDAEIIAVAQKAQAHDFIMLLEKGYDTLVGERGIKLSGGQKQRVAIARAMLKDAPVLLLDEATSALDSESEVEIQKALHILMEGKTVIAVAHRLSTLREMDRIIVLEEGKIVEDGTHDELSVGGGTYQKLWEHQAGGFLTE